VLGRLFAESIENAGAGPAFALRCRGTSEAKIFWYATLPQILPQLASYTLYRWENNIRAAAVLGVVGAGGLGQMLAFHMGLFQMGGGVDHRALVRDGATLVDVRTDDEFRAGHMQGAKNIPVHEIEQRLNEIPKDRKVVVYCRSGGRSASAAAVLQRKGYDVVDIGPMHAW
jgi:rhodanese-related sulfurtransferase